MSKHGDDAGLCPGLALTAFNSPECPTSAADLAPPKWRGFFLGYNEEVKRGGFLKRRTPLKRGTTRLKKARTDSVGKLKKKLWELCKQITRARYQNSDGSWNCYTCDVLITDSKSAHTGHFIARASGGASLYFNLDGLRVQCPVCNLWRGGEGALYMHRLIKEIGQERVDALVALKRQIVKADRFFYQSLIDQYEKEAERL